MSEAPEVKAGSPVAETNPHAESVRKLAAAMQRDMLLAGSATVLVAVIVSTVWVGVPGLLGALTGGVIGLASALATTLMMRKSADLPPMFVMVVALGGYAGKLVVLLVTMILLRGVTALHPKALAFTMLAVILVVAAAEMRAFKRTKIPTIIPGSTPWK